MSMYLYTDCPECESRGYDTDTRICKRCIGTTFIPVRVKALEWDDWWTEEPDKFKRLEYGVGPDKVIGANYQTFDEFQAACQAHHERMVMDMLEVVP